MNNFYNLFIKNGAHSIEFYAQNGLTESYSLSYPNIAPTDNDVLVWDNATSSLKWVDTSSFGAGSVSSVGLSAPASFTVSGSPITTTGTLALDWVAQSGNKVIASPANGTNGAPSFRALVDADMPSTISASKINGVLAKSNIPSGTIATSFQLNNASGAIIADETGSGVKIFDNTGAVLGDLYCQNLYVSGNIDQTTTTTVNLGDSVLRLNANFDTGTPTENAGLSVRRGSQNDAILQWIESSDDWQLGLSSNLKPITRRHEQSIVNADLSAGVYTLTHNLGKRPQVEVIDNNGVSVGMSINHTNENTATINFSRVGTLTGTWRIVANG